MAPNWLPFLLSYLSVAWNAERFYDVSSLVIPLTYLMANRRHDEDSGERGGRKRKRDRKLRRVVERGRAGVREGRRDIAGAEIGRWGVKHWRNKKRLGKRRYKERKERVVRASHNGQLWLTHNVMKT